MYGKRAFLKKFFGDNVMPIEPDGFAQMKAPVGVVVVSPFLDWDYYFIHAPIGWTPENYTEPGLLKLPFRQDS